MAEGDNISGGEGGGTGGGEATFASSLPETLRSHEAFKDVKDAGDLADRYVKAITPKPFAETLPEKIRGEAAFADIKDLDGLANSYLHAQKMIGVPKDQLLRVPASDKPEDWAPIYDRLGRPKEYKMPTPPEGVAVDENFMKDMLATMHAEGLSQKQVDRVYDKYFEAVKTGLDNIGAQQAKAKADAEATLKAEYGAAYPDLAKNIGALLNHLDGKIGGKGDLQKELDLTGIGNFPNLTRALNIVAKNYIEDGIVGKAEGSSGGMSPAEAQQQINKKLEDPAFRNRYLNRGPGHDEAVQEIFALRQMVRPEAA